jgi:Galactose oxidase, central domain
MIRLKAHKSATIRTLASAGLIAIGLVVSTAIPARAGQGGGSGTFSATRSMNTARMGHTATLLNTGQVLVAGGDGTTGPNSLAPIASAELYNPALGKWTVTGSMATPRLGFTATLLPNGQVLVTGGSPDDFSCLATAELFNPARAPAQLLQNGKVLFAGGVNVANGTTTPLASAELFDASEGRWNFTGSLSSPGSSIFDSLLANGDVLMVNRAFFNPATGTWTNTGSFPAETAGGTTATLLGTGKVLVTGLISLYRGSAFAPTTEALLYDFSTNSYARTGSMNTARANGSATLLPNGQVLVAGGYNKETLCPGCSLAIVPLASAEIYTP